MKTDEEWLPVQDTVRKRKTKKTPDLAKNKKDVLDILDLVDARLNIVYGELLRGQELFIRKGRPVRSDWIREIEYLRFDIKSFVSDVKEYGLSLEEDAT